MSQKKAESDLIEKILQASIDLGVYDGKISKVWKTAVDAISRSEESLHTYFEKFPSSKAIDVQDSLSKLPVPEIKHINKLPEDIEYINGIPVSGFIQVTFNEIRVFKDDALKKEPRLIFDGFAQGLKLHPDKASQIFSQLSRNGEEPLPAFCASTSRHGVFINIPEGYSVANPLIIDVNADSFSGLVAPFYFLFLIEKNAYVDILVKIHSQNEKSQPSLLAMQMEGILGQSSRMNIIEVQDLSRQADLAFNEAIYISENASLNYLEFDQGGLMVDRHLQIILGEEKGSAQITGLYIPDDHSTYSYTTSQHHNASNTNSDLLYKGVLGGEARVNWNGNILVMQGTQGVDGYQMNNNLLTSDKVQVNSIPGLEILTDDVRCSHGVTISDIDESQRLYLQSRGISQEESEQLIIEGFLKKALARIGDSILHKVIKRELPGSMNTVFEN